ncbi:hypothetical protein RE628_09165 [Paenibacillus sp. D2_2]|uniref:hypothetical protein n=1 Tax=Paenibacillus sp. D2_2 TaxID=3073092 RepID=UPI0028169D23|nr:hypothetical protein [Paenibacillus sp. D2_2]WMT42491.1 hypothetical protein RE628_09165 [Paenibacillus sp. D2_2]
MDFGDIKRKNHVENLTNEFTLAPESLRFYMGFVVETLTEINAWIDNNHGDFFIDESRLEVYKSPKQMDVNLSINTEIK